MSFAIQKLKLILLYFGKKDQNQFLRTLHYKRYPTQFAFDAYSGLNVWSRYLTIGEEELFINIWCLQFKEKLKNRKILERFIINSIGIFIIIEKEYLKEFQEFWNDTLSNYPILLMTNFEFNKEFIEKYENLKHVLIKNLESYDEIENIFIKDISEIKNINVKYVCADCNHELIMIPDGNFRYCFCGKSGINHSNEYTRLLGNVIEKRNRIK
ncbi:MAG: hypothetical protein EAX96_15405 [Candidatus Lokiarchaeota archaeon]|nr:hypothetical protein [Candidatus Lokiarchaeota archaeon]